MSPLVTRPTPPALELRRDRIEHVRARAAVRERTWLEGAVVFAIAFAVYAAVGLWTTLGLDIVLVDAQSRLENAYQVWWNDPGKLAAIGFYWPPVQTLVLTPFTAVKPLATSMAALPLMSAVFGAALLATLDRLLATVRLERALRWSIVVLFGLNPMILFYSTNGMSEIVTLFLLALALTLWILWTTDPRWYYLPLAGLVFGVGVLARYEVGLWLPLVVAAAIAVLMRRRQTVETVEAALLALVVPTLYAVIAWSFLNLELTGNFLGWLTALVPSEGGGERVVETSAELLWRPFAVHATYFLPVVVAAVAVAVVAVRKRDATAIALAAALLVNIVSTLYFVTRAKHAFLLEPRYNMRAMPIAIIAVAWLAMRIPRHRHRLLGLATAAVLAVSIPLTGFAMLHPYEAVGEAAFVRGLMTGTAQDGIRTPRGTGISRHDQREMASWVREHVPERDAILLDDAQTFGIQVTDGDPARYFDRVDRGDEAWRRALERPRSVRYLLVSRDEFRPDLIVLRYPRLRDPQTPTGFVELAHANPSYVLWRVLPPETA